MKMMYGGVPVESIKVKHYEVSTNDCDMIASDLQAGKTAVARGQKITGTGKSFEFAQYGQIKTNQNFYVPADINVIQVSSTDYPIQSETKIAETKNVDYTTTQSIGTVTIDTEFYPITIAVNNNILRIECDRTIDLQIFYGRDRYI